MLEEERRLFYVALTRARSQVVLWWVRGHHCHRSPLGRLLHGPDRTEEPGDDGCGAGYWYGASVQPAAPRQRAAATASRVSSTGF